MLKVNVFNINNSIYVKDIINARNEAINKGFELFQFNNSIYFIDGKKNIHKTKYLYRINWNNNPNYDNI